MTPEKVPEKVEPDIAPRRPVGAAELVAAGERVMVASGEEEPEPELVAVSDVVPEAPRTVRVSTCG
jgi:hypothetical protein